MELKPYFKVLGNKYVFLVKILAYGGLDKYKLRPVAKGFHQIDSTNLAQSAFTYADSARF